MRVRVPRRTDVPRPRTRPEPAPRGSVSRAPPPPPEAPRPAAPAGGGRGGAGRRRPPRRWRAAALAALAGGALLAGCFDPGEPTPREARVTWAAYPETVVAGREFSFEAAGPLSTNSCGRFDTLFVDRSDSAVTVSSRRQIYTEAWCTDDRLSFYAVRVLTMPWPGRFPVRTAEGRDLGTMVVRDSGAFSNARATGEGTVRWAGGCLFFGPGWAHNQRPFPLRDAPDRLAEVAETDTVVFVGGELWGYRQCGGYGTRPSIRVDTFRVTDRTGDEWYDDGG